MEDSVPDNPQLQVCWILMLKLGHLAHKTRLARYWYAKHHIPVHDADWFKCNFWQLYFKADWSEIHFFSVLSFPFYSFVFTLAENIHFYLACMCEEALGSKIWWKYYRLGREKY